ncbi:hypothetical protein M514_28579, partial [Trichuris suis]
MDRLMEEYFSCAMKPLEVVLNDELEKLANVRLPDLLLMSRILSTLPQEYFEFKSVWESVPVSDRSVNLLVERLRLIEMRLPDKTLIKKRNKKRGRKCFNCHQNGHFAKSCPIRQNGNKEQVRQFKGGETFFCYRVEGNSDASAAWLADSGASHHMTWNKKYFTKYVPFPQHVE